MSELWSRTIDGIRVIRDREDGALFRFVPGAPTARLITAIDLGEGIDAGPMMVQLETKWEVAPEAIEALRKKLSEEMRVDASSLRLTPAMADSLKAQIVLAKLAKSEPPFVSETEPDAATVLAESGTSGFPPHNAIVNLNVPPSSIDVQKRLRAALAGTTGLLWARYVGTVAVEGGIESTVTGRPDVTTVAHETAPGDASTASVDDPWIAVVRRAVDEGAMRVVGAAVPWASDEEIQTSRRQAMSHAARALRMSALMSSSGTPEIRGHDVSAAHLAIDGWTDVGASIPPITTPTTTPSS